MLTAGSAAEVYTYDANGNRETLTIGGQSRSYVYNIENRLSEVRDASDSLIASYQYDPFGRRISKIVGGTIRYFYYADEGLIAEFDNTGTQLQAYGYTPDSMWGTDPTYTKLGAQYYYYLNDHIGTSQKIIAANGSVVWSSKQSAFGETTIDSISSISNPLRFAGQYYDEETGTNYNHFRYYDLDTGRYTQSDPIALRGGMNTYLYVYNNPLRYVDPYGLKTVAFSVNVNLGWGLGITGGINLVWDGNGNIGIQSVYGGGGDTPGGSVIGNVEFTSASTIFDLEGVSGQAGVDGGLGIVGEGGGLFGDGYTGWYLGLGVGKGTPIGASGYVTNTVTIAAINIPSIIKDIKDFFDGFYPTNGTCL